MNPPLEAIGKALARYLAREVTDHGLTRPTPLPLLRAALRPGDVLLVEGYSRISTAIKYLTQSSWSHAALFVGDHLAEAGGNPEHCIVEADTLDGVRSAGLEQIAAYPSRICRPIGLDEDARHKVTGYAIGRIGNRYDLRNIFDLARYLLPTVPVPSRFRRRLIGLGSGDPTQAICSTLIAQAFEAIRYPILPHYEIVDADSPDCPMCAEEILHQRHHSLYTPRDFDVSPYFSVVKPTLEAGFNHRSLVWAGAPVVDY